MSLKVDQIPMWCLPSAVWGPICWLYEDQRYCQPSSMASSSSSVAAVTFPESFPETDPTEFLMKALKTILPNMIRMSLMSVLPRLEATDDHWQWPLAICHVFHSYSGYWCGHKLLITMASAIIGTSGFDTDLAPAASGMASCKAHGSPQAS